MLTARRRRPTQTARRQARRESMPRNRWCMIGLPTEDSVKRYRYVSIIALFADIVDQAVHGPPQAALVNALAAARGSSIT